MRNDNPDPNRSHPTIGELLLYKEAEMDPIRAKLTEDHLAGCEKCRQECAAVSQGMLNFMALVHSAQVPAPQSSPSFLATSAHEVAASPRARRSFFPAFARSFAAFSMRRMAFAGVFVCLVVIGVLLFQASQPSARASQFLTRSIAGSDSIEKSHKVLRQNVRIQQGSRVVEKGILRGVKYQSGGAQIRDAVLEETLRQAAVDWDDPLNPRDFARWRDMQKGGSDKLSESAIAVTITTATQDPVISAESLTLARSDWHPVARRIDFKAQLPVQITEIGSELIDADTVASAHIPPADLSAPEGPKPPSTFQMEESELRLRETLSSLGMDTTAAPEIWRGRDSVHFRAYPVSPGDAEKLRAAVRSIPFVVEGRAAPAVVSGATPPLNREYESGAPFAGALEKGLGGLEQANQYLTSIQDQYRRTLAQSAVVSGLSERYPAGYSMPESLETRLELLVAGHVAEEKRELLAYLELLSKGMELLGAKDIQEAAPGGNCEQWQEPARSVAAGLRDLQLSFMRLFVADKSETALADTPEAMLARCERLKASLARHLAALCAPAQ